MCNDVFNDFAEHKDRDFFPKDIETEHAKLSDFLYDNINNGVYRAGFATRQQPYERACRRVFEAFDQLEERLPKNRYLLAIGLSKLTGDYFARWFASTSSITAILNAICAGSSIIRICKAI